MAISLRGNNGLLPRLNNLIKLQRLKHAFANGEVFGDPLYPGMDFHSGGRQDAANIDISKWKKVDGRVFGINRSRISSPSWTVLKILHSKGFEAYLVGGCVRDLLLNRVPKDFDVITTAGLKQIRKQFHRARIVGRRFPICMVDIKGSVIEISSFETKAKHNKEKEAVKISQIPRKCDKKDLTRWRNSMHRDFTINSLFFDPFLNIIYDYAEGIADVRSLKLRTLIPASLSFKEDCARILRGLRLAARLGLSFSKDTETAMSKLSSSITSLDKSRIMMEVNYMLSYGAAVPSLCLLQRFNLLEILLPFHAAYLNEQSTKKYPVSSMMLMKLFFNLDKLVSCDRPSDCSIWVGLLAFHMALVNNPQDSLVVLAFAATLYHGGWNKGVNVARENAQVGINFVPEITTSAQFKSDEELARGVTHFASIVRGSVTALTAQDHLLEATSKFPVFPCTGLVFVPKKTAKHVGEIFEVLVNDIESYKNRRKNFEIDHQSLGKGTLSEARFVLGKIVLETLNNVIFQDVHGEERNLSVDIMPESHNSALSDLVNEHLVIKNERKARKQTCSSEVMPEANKRHESVQEEGSHSAKMVESKKCINTSEKHKSVVDMHRMPCVELRKQESMLETNKCHILENKGMEHKQEVHETMRKNQVKEMNYDKMVESKKCINTLEKHKSVVDTHRMPPDELSRKQDSMSETNKCHLLENRDMERKQEIHETMRKNQVKDMNYDKIVDKKCINTSEKHKSVVDTHRMLHVELNRRQESMSETNKCHLLENREMEDKQEVHETKRKNQVKEINYDKMVESKKCINTSENHKSVVDTHQMPHVELNRKQESMTETNKCHLLENREMEDKQEVHETKRKNQVKEMIQPQEADDKVTEKLLRTVEGNTRKRKVVIGQEGKTEKKKLSSRSQAQKEQRVRPLSSLFK